MKDTWFYVCLHLILKFVRAFRQAINKQRIYSTKSIEAASATNNQMEKQADDNHDKAKVLKAEIIKVTEETLVKETEETILSKDRQAVEVNSDSDSDKADEGDDRDKIFMSK